TCIRQPKRIASCISESGTASVSGRGSTEPSKARVSDRDTCVLPLPIGFKPAFETPKKRSQYRVAHVDRVLRKRETRAELALDLGIGPAGDVNAQPVTQGIFDVVEPAHRVEIVVARLRVDEADILVDEHRIAANADAVADQLSAGAIGENDSAKRFVLKHGPEERRRQEIEVDVALPIDVQVKLVKRAQGCIVAEVRIAGRNLFNRNGGSAPEFAADVSAPGMGKTGQEFVSRREIDRHVRQRLTIDEHKA